MTEETVVRTHPRSRMRALLEAFEMWKRRRRLLRLLAEIVRRGDDHLLRDIGMDCRDPGEGKPALLEMERARQHFWML